MHHRATFRRMGAWWKPRAAVSGGLLCLAASFALPAAAQSVRFEAESYQNFGSGSGLSKTGGSSGLGLETRDAVGKDGQHVSGSFVTYFRNSGANGLQEYLEYKVTIPQDGMYTLTVRGAYPSNSAAAGFRVWDLSSGVVLDGSFDVRASGGLWAEDMAVMPLVADVEAAPPELIPIPFKAGDHTLRIYAMNRGVNPDWWELTRVGDITDYGVVSGKVTDGAKGIGPAQVFADVSLSGNGLPGVNVGFGFRAITDASGNYRMLLPTGMNPMDAAAPGYDVDNRLSPPATILVDAATPQTQDFSLFQNLQTETEWFASARNSPVPNGFGYGAYDRGGSWGQVVGQFQMPGFYLTYDVNVPSDGLYTFTLQHSLTSTNADAQRLALATSTGYWAEDSLTPSTGSNYEPYNFEVPVPLKAGANTITLIQPTLTSHNTDFWTLTDMGQEFGTLTGTVGVTGSGTVDGAIVTVQNGSGKTVGRAVVGADGKWTILAAPGDYTVSAAKSGYDGTTANATVTAGQSAAATVSLAPSTTVTIVPQDLAEIFNGANEVPRVYYPYSGSPSNATIGNLGTDSWVEFPFNVTMDGVYSLTLDYSAANPAADIPANRTVVVDIREEGSSQHFTTQDITLAPTGDNHAFVPLTAEDKIPLRAGRYILRVHNVTGLHVPPPATAQRSTTSTNIGRVTLTRTAEPPAYTTLTGTVTSQDLGLNVANAMVLANPAGSEVAQPGPFSYHGFWTTTGADGKYSLSLPVGTYTVQAGRPDSYIQDGATVPNVTAAEGGATANLSLLSKWVSGTLRVESEYYHDKVGEAPGSGSGTGVQLIPFAGASNGYRLGAFGAEDWIRVLADVPSTGSYNVTLYYVNSSATPADPLGDVRVTVNNGAAMNGTLPPGADQATLTSFTFPEPFPLTAGMNSIELWNIGAGAEFDAIELTRVAPPVTPAMKALRIAGGLDEATADDMANLNVVTTGASATTIDMLDAVELARQG